MLITPASIIIQSAEEGLKNDSPGTKQQSCSFCDDNGSSLFVSDMEISLTKAIGKLQNGKTTHYYRRALKKSHRDIY